MDKRLVYDAAANEQRHGVIKVMEGDEAMGRGLAAVLRAVADYFEEASDDATPDEVHERRRRAFARYEEIRSEVPDVAELLAALQSALRPWTDRRVR